MLFRSKSGRSKGYAFVEFLHLEVAKVVVETMNNYLMFEKLLKCKIVTKEKGQKNIFKGKINPNNPPAKLKRFAAKKKVNAMKTDVQEKRRLKRQMRGNADSQCLYWWPFL